MTEVAHVLGWNPVRGETKSGSWETEGENALCGCRSTGIDQYELIGSSQHPYGAGAVIIPILQMRLSDLFKATQLASGRSQMPWGRVGPLPTAWPPGGPRGQGTHCCQSKTQESRCGEGAAGDSSCGDVEATPSASPLLRWRSERVKCSR